MIDKLSSITTGNSQNKRASDENRIKDSSPKVSKNSQDSTNKDVSEVKISSELNIKGMSAEAPIDTKKVSAIKDAIAKGDYPIDLEKVANALLQAYKDIK